MPCLLARLTYFSIAFSPLIVLCLSKRLAHNVNLVLGGFLPPIYFPLNLPPAKGE